MAVRQAGKNTNPRLGYWTLIGFCGFFAALSFVLDKSKLTLKVDRLLHDNWVRFGQSVPDDDLLVVGFDSKSVEIHGRWPWSRRDQAKIIDNIAAAGAQVIVADILYSEPDRIDPVADQILTASITAAGNVILPIITEGRGTGADLEERLPIASIASAARDLGHVFTPIDSDGIVRRVYLKAGFNSPHWSTMSLVAMETQNIEPRPVPGMPVENPKVSNHWLADKEVLIPFHGPKNTFKTISAIDVLNNKFDHAGLNGSVVFLGFTATGLGDTVPTPISGEDQPIPGVEVHANIYSALRAGTTVTQSSRSPAYLLVLVSISVLLVVYTRLRPRWGLLSTFAMASLPILISYLSYSLAGIWFAPLVASIPILLAFPFWSWHRLEFAGRFLRHETDKLAIYDDDIGLTGKLPLSSIFETASRHLGLNRWFFQVDDDQLQARGDIRDLELDKIHNSVWSKKAGFTVKRFSGAVPLTIGFDFGQRGLDRQFSAFVDSASRVRRLVDMPMKGGTIENLQKDADRLSQQNQRILQLKELNDNIFNGSPAGLIVWNSIGEMMQYNRTAAAMFDEDKIKSMSVDHFLAMVGRDPQLIDSEPFQALMRDGSGWQLNVSRDSRELVIDFNSLGKDLSNRLIVASAVDLSEIRRAERLRSELIDYLSHDLRSPLISSLYLVSQQRESGRADKAEMLQVEANINKTLKMIDDLLGLTRAEHLEIDQLQPVFFENVIENTIDQMLPQARQSDIEFSIDTFDEEVWISADASLLERAFSNVVGNAIKYSGHGTVVKIFARVEHGEEIVVQVSDQGIGIPADRIGMLFERFHRDPEAQRQYKGTGLGLALVSKVVKQHGGSVVAKSEERKGTTIEIRLPVLEIESEVSSLTA